MFKGKKILIGVTGSIAAYKTPLLIRELAKAGAEVKAVMTPSAKRFVTEDVLSNLTRNPVAVEMFDETAQKEGAWHIQLAEQCDAMFIAPCTAATLARIASGLCDTALTAVALALPPEKPLIIAPSMDSHMWLNPATQRNVETLKNDGVIIIPPESGELASGLEGPGRLPEIDVLMKNLESTLKSDEKNRYSAKQTKAKTISKSKNDSQTVKKESATIENNDDPTPDYGDFFNDKKVLITAGPTREKIDDVRYIGNYSSGKMGYALAAVARKAGAKVTLVSGPVSLQTPAGVERIDVESAAQMKKKTLREYEDSDIAILAAAVADYAPAAAKKGKIKKDEAGDSMKLDLKATDDILYELGSRKKPGQVLVGFALETEDAIISGWKKLKTKNCNIIIVNYANKPRSGFGGDENTITILNRNGAQKSFDPMSKIKCAQEILKNIAETF